MLSRLHLLFTKNISPSGLSLFRICYNTVLLFEVFFIYEYKEFIYDPIPFIEVSDLQLGPSILIWMGVVVSMILGYKTRYMAMANYVFTLIFISSNNNFEYHMHCIYTIMNFLMIFMPLDENLSLERFFSDKKSRKVPVFFYSIPLFFGIGMLYFDSVFFKFKSEIWMTGMGVWLPAVIPQTTLLEPNWMLDQRWLMLILGYYTLAFETLFIFLIWHKWSRLYAAISGILLHIGIFIVFPIPLFALGMIAIYILALPVGWIDKIILKFTKLELSDEPFKLKNIEIKSFKILFLVLVLLQANVTFNHNSGLSDYTTRLYNKIKLRSLKRYTARVKNFSIRAFGIGPHGVFIDHHFENYNHIVAVKHIGKENETWLPYVWENGALNEDIVKGPNWAYIYFRVNSPTIDQQDFENGIMRLTADWAAKNKISLDDTSFEILAKRIDLPENFQWEKGYIEKQRKVPWKSAGQIIWKDKQASFQIKIIEDIY
ncbi:HTTM domain-containing protein [uncultured Dokdonia sp.]|uniref:HTTM domain-containing protein n=1 Tax=uncultured Dokdonia sp. TaxID=575653 RepID=UPI002629D780|nr:HTTM domain-containing protein [uncultured Dokdonia sp.]